MQKYFDTVFDVRRGPISGASVTVTNQDGSLATIYSDNGLTTKANPTTTDANGRFQFYAADGRYNVQISGFRIVTQEIRDILLEDPADSPTATTANLAASSGSSMVGHIASGTGAVARTVQSKERDTVSVKDYGAIGNGVTDDTAAIQAAVNAVYAAGGGTVYAPAGDYVVNGTVSLNYTGSTPVNIAGAGQYATRFKRTGGSTGALFAWSSPSNVLNTYAGFAGFAIVGNSKAHNGLSLTNVARFVLDRVLIKSCDKAINNAGSLVYQQLGCTLEANNIGVYARAANGVSANLVLIQGGQISANTTWGLDIGGGSAWTLKGVDVSANGTAGNTATGGIMVRSSVTSETGYAVITVEGGWFEANKGRAFDTEGSADLNISFRDVSMYGNEAGRCINIPQARHFLAENLIAGSASDTVTVAATNSIIIGGTITALTDTSNYRNYIGLTTSTSSKADTTSLLYIDGPTGNNTVIGSDDQIGGGSVNDLSVFHYGSGRVVLWAGSQKKIQYNATGLGFNGNNPMAAPATGAMATDLASALTLANQLRAILINYGLATA